MLSIPRLLQEEHLHMVKRDKCEFKLLVRPEQENIASIKDFSRKLKEVGILPAELLLRYSMVHKVFVSLPVHRSFMRREVDPIYVTEKTL